MINDNKSHLLCCICNSPLGEQAERILNLGEPKGYICDLCNKQGKPKITSWTQLLGLPEAARKEFLRNAGENYQPDIELDNPDTCDEIRYRMIKLEQQIAESNKKIEDLKMWVEKCKQDAKK